MKDCSLCPVSVLFDIWRFSFIISLLGEAARLPGAPGKMWQINNELFLNILYILWTVPWHTRPACHQSQFSGTVTLLMLVIDTISSFNIWKCKTLKPHTQRSLYFRGLLYYCELKEVRAELELCQNWSLFSNFSAIVNSAKPNQSQHSPSEASKVFNDKLNISRHQPSVDKSVQVNRKSPKFNLLPENLFLELDIRLGFVCSILRAACPA